MKTTQSPGLAKKTWMFLMIVSVLIFIFYLVLSYKWDRADSLNILNVSVNEKEKEDKDVRTIDQIDWFIIDVACLRRLDVSLWCKVPIKVAARQSTRLSESYNITHYINVNATKSYVELQPVDEKDKVIRLLPRDLKIHQNKPISIIAKNKQTINYPAKLQLFTRQWISSRMLQCDRIQKNTSLEYKFNGRRKIPLTGLHLFEDVRRVLAEITVVPFLLFGSLLGWYRDCTIIWHTNDIDMGVLPEDLSPKLLQHIRNTQSMIHILGNQYDLRQPPEMTFRIDGVSIDLFTTAIQNATHMYTQLFNFLEPRSYRLVLPRIVELCAADLHDYLVHVPCNVEAFLQADYGNWREPVTGSNYPKKNHVFNRKFTDSEWSQHFELFN